jgi:hypothetical protein
MTPETILDLAKQQGYALTPARAQELAHALNATLSVIQRIPVAFEAEPEAFHSVLEAGRAPAGGR